MQELAPMRFPAYHATMIMDLLCKVVDNFGDIGVVWRLAKALKQYRPELELRIIVDDLAVFAAINPQIDPTQTFQILPTATVIHWNNPAELLTRHRATVCVEAFACGRPDWYDALLHDPANPVQRLHISLEYLSAEDYVAEFHLLPSLSPIPQVKKIFFMPGFDTGTGGLILDPAFLHAKATWQEARVAGKLAKLRRDFWATLSSVPVSRAEPGRIATSWVAGSSSVPNPEGFWISLFSYEHGYTHLVSDLGRWALTRSANQPAPVVLVASGKSAAGFFQAWEAAGRPFAAYAIPFLPQVDWDQLLLACDLNIVRGEESLARAAISGLPFLWHAYLQDEGYQHVKADALVERMKRHFDGGPAWQSWSSLMGSFNQRTVNSADRVAIEDYLTMLNQLEELRSGFNSFAQSLEKLGDCAQALLSLSEKTG